MMSEPSPKCENDTIFKHNYTLKLFISFKMAYFCCFSLGGTLDFPDFLQKSFITLTTEVRSVVHLHLHGGEELHGGTKCRLIWLIFFVPTYLGRQLEPFWRHYSLQMLGSIQVHEGLFPLLQYTEEEANWPDPRRQVNVCFRTKASLQDLNKKCACIGRSKPRCCLIWLSQWHDTYSIASSE